MINPELAFGCLRSATVQVRYKWYNKCDMAHWLESFILTFLPLFIVIDALGNLPFVISLSEGMSRHERRKMIHIATITAVIVGLAFLFLGQFILNVLGISVTTHFSLGFSSVFFSSAILTPPYIFVICSNEPFKNI